MFEDTILPIRTKFKVPSRSQSRIYFVQDKTKDSLFFIKWTELVLCLVCLGFVIITIGTTEVPKVGKILIIFANSAGALVVLTELTYPYFKRSLPLILQVLCPLTNLSVFSMATVQIYSMNNNHELIKTMLFLDGLATVLFLVDFICRIIISTYLYRITRVRTVADVAVSACVPPTSSGNKPKCPPRSILTTTPITYGGTFAVGKDQPPFLAEERTPTYDSCQTLERGTRTRTVQTPLYIEGRSMSNLFYSVGTDSADRITKTKCIQTYLEHEEKGTSTTPLQTEEERRKKSPWTYSTPNSSRKFDARKQASMSTPITYSGTFAVNKELVPITPSTISGMSPKSSPRKDSDKPNKKNMTTFKSEGTSPARTEHMFLDLERLDQISEEKISQLSSEDSSVKKSYTYFDSSLLPGSVIEDNDQYDQEENENYFIT